MDIQQASLDSYKWITFRFDTNRLSYRVWYLLGQILAKCDQISGIPLSPDIAERMHLVYLAKGARATVAIEGNTLTEDEVQQLVPADGTLDLPPSMEYLETEAKNVIRACNAIKDAILSNNGEVSPPLTIDEIKHYHSIILSGLPVEEQVVPGEFRTYPAGVGHYFGVRPEDILPLLNRLCVWLNSRFDVPKNLQDPIGILKAILAHLYIEWIHPFGDGNGRTGRMVEFRLLLSAGLPTVAAHLLTNHYNQTRSEYYRHLDMSSKLENDEGVYLFVEYALQGFVDQLNGQIESATDHLLDISWESYIYEEFGTKPSDRERRQRQLALDLSKHKEPVPLNQLRHVSARVAEEYATLADKTFRRDVRELFKRQLLRTQSGAVEANRGLMRGFLAPRRDRHNH